MANPPWRNSTIKPTGARINKIDGHNHGRRRREIVTVDENRSDGMRKLAVDADGYLAAKYVKFAEFPTLYHQGAGPPSGCNNFR